MLIFIGLQFVMGFYYDRNVFVKLNDVTVELGDKLPEEITNYVSLLTDRSNLTLESSVPLTKDGKTSMIGTYNYYLVYNDNNYKFSTLTNAKSTIKVVDTKKPKITIKENNEFDYGYDLNVSDIAECFDLSGCKLHIKEDVDTTKSGEVNITIVASDGANNKSYQTTKIKIKEKPQPVYNYDYSYAASFEDLNNQIAEKNSSLSDEDKIILREQVANFAKQFIGNPYVPGGVSLTNGADCSGFTMSIYANFGYSIPRVATSQAYVGMAVSEAELQPGDLVVYYYGHAGIYVGNGLMVHAATSQDGILLAPMFSGYRTYRRIIY